VILTNLLFNVTDRVRAWPTDTELLVFINEHESYRSKLTLVAKVGVFLFSVMHRLSFKGFHILLKTLYSPSVLRNNLCLDYEGRLLESMRNLFYHYVFVPIAINPPNLKKVLPVVDEDGN